MSVADCTQSPEVEYRDIPGQPGYKAGTDGSIWSYWRSKGWGGGWRIVPEPQRRLKPKLYYPKRVSEGEPYEQVRLMGDGCDRHVGVHRLVLETFFGPCPEGMQGRHLDGNPSNNSLGNLCWGTPLENHADKIRHGTSGKGEENPRAKLTDEQVVEIRRLLDNGGTYRGLSNQFGVGQATIGRIKKRESWKHV